MNFLSFNQINKHEIYSCSLKPYKNIFCLAKLSFFKFTVNSKQNDLTEILTLLAFIKIILNKNPLLKIFNYNQVKKITVFSDFSKTKQNIILKNVIFDFIFLNQQKIPNIYLSINFFFSTLNILSFSVLNKYYCFIKELILIHFSFFVINVKNIEKYFFGRILRLPLFKKINV
jgi:hypothetical protein